LVAAAVLVVFNDEKEEKEEEQVRWVGCVDALRDPNGETLLARAAL